jgi:DNA-binding IclR family transcriptional regulator
MEWFTLSQSDTSVRAIERALDVLNCFKQEHQELSLTEISQRVGLPLSTTSRIVATLENRNYLARGGSNKLFLGQDLVNLCNYCFSHLDFISRALYYMVELRNTYNESVSLYVVQGDSRVCVARVESTHALRRVINVGDHFILTRGAAGRLLLAYQPLEHKKRLIEKDPFTTLEQLEKICRDKYVYSMSEREEGVVSVAAPIFNREKKVVAAIACSWPTARFHEEQLQERILKTIEYAEIISKAIGN